MSNSTVHAAAVDGLATLYAHQRYWFDYVCLLSCVGQVATSITASPWVPSPLIQLWCQEVRPLVLEYVVVPALMIAAFDISRDP